MGSEGLGTDTQNDASRKRRLCWEIIRSAFVTDCCTHIN